MKLKSVYFKTGVNTSHAIFVCMLVEMRSSRSAEPAKVQRETAEAIAQNANWIELNFH